MSHHAFDWRPLFLAALRDYPVVRHACDIAKVQRASAYRARKADKAFAQQWDDAMENGVDRAEQEAFRRAVTGFDEPVIYQGTMTMIPLVDAAGKPVHDDAGTPVLVPLTVRRFSDAMLSLVLKGRRKSYSTERTEVTGAAGGPVAINRVERAARLSAILAAANGRKAAAEISPDDLG